MLKKLFKFSVLTAVIILGVASRCFADDSKMEDFTLSSQDRILVFAPHPDDEVLGAAGILQRAVSMKLPVKVAFFTYGDSNQWSFLLYRRYPVVIPGAVEQMGLIRRDEAVAASDILGVGLKNLVFMGYPDFGTLNIWYAHWNDRPPYRSLLTRVTKVPYQGALRPGAPYKGEEIVTDLRTILREFKPTKIFVSHPADHNGDHLSLYLYLRVALWDEQMSDAVALYPYLIHYIGWPKPMGFHPEKDLTPPSSLDKVIHWKQYHLTQEEFDFKKAALAAHKSQYRSSPRYLLSFVKHNEIFGDFPMVHLHMNENSSVFSMQHKVIQTGELPDELNSREKNAFVGVEWKFLRWEGNDLIISIQLSKPLAQDVEASIYIFGYSPKISFAEMPKINVQLGVLSYTVYDQKRKIEQSSIQIKRTPNNITLVVPMKLLGNPDRILTSARTYLGNVPLDSASWVAMELSKE